MKSNGQPPKNTKPNKNINETLIVLRHVIRSLVDFPDQVTIQAIEGQQTVVFEVLVATIDIKRVIGRKGRTADAIRLLLSSIGGKVKSRYILEIIEPTFRVQEIPLDI